MKKVKCHFCKREFEVHDYREKTVKYCSKRCMGRGSVSLFKDGHSAYNKGVHTCKIRFKSLHRNWSKKVRDRDNWTCQRCGVKKSNVIAHHKKDWDNYPELRFDVNNGETLCRSCHPIIHNLQKI